MQVLNNSTYPFCTHKPASERQISTESEPSTALYASSKRLFRTETTKRLNAKVTRAFYCSGEPLAPRPERPNRLLIPVPLTTVTTSLAYDGFNGPEAHPDVFPRFP